MTETIANRARTWTAEKTAWWVVFGILTLTLIGMLGLWN